MASPLISVADRNGNFSAAVRENGTNSDGNASTNDASPTKYISVEMFMAKELTDETKIRRLQELWGDKIRPDNKCLTYLSKTRKGGTRVFNNCWNPPMNIPSCWSCVRQVRPTMRLQFISCRAQFLLNKAKKNIYDLELRHIRQEFEFFKEKILGDPYLFPWRKQEIIQNAIGKMNARLEAVNMHSVHQYDEGIREERLQAEFLRFKYWNECHDWNLLNSDLDAGLVPVEQLLNINRAGKLAKNFDIIYGT